MSREIKFRAWDKVNKTMCTDAINNCKDTFDMVLKHPQIYDVMQFSGLRDKNGVEVFEGDKARVDDYVAIIEWDTETCRFVLNIHGENLIYDFDNFYGHDLEVIGNIYENPELLTGTAHE